MDTTFNVCTFVFLLSMVYCDRVQSVVFDGTKYAHFSFFIGFCLLFILPTNI